MRKSQKEKILEKALASGFSVREELERKDWLKERWNQEVFYLEKGGKGLRTAFDLDTAKFVGSSHCENGQIFSIAHLKFRQVLGYFDPIKLYGEVEWVEGEEPAVGVGATLCHYTDRDAFTVVEVINEKKIVVRACKATLKEDWKPEVIPGGFAGHCANNYSQEYDYEDNLEAVGRVFTLRKNGRWHEEGQSTRSSQLVLGRRSHFYDYNF